VDESTTGAESIWLFEDDATDEKGNHTLTATGGATYVTTPTPPQGTYGGDVNGLGRYFAVPSFDYGNEFTLVFEVYFGDSNGLTIYGALNANDGFRLYLNVTGDDAYFNTGNGTTTDAAVATNCGLSINTYTMIAVVVDRTAGTALIYVDGVDETDDSSIRTDFETSTTANIGSGYSPGTYLYGYVDAVQVYKWKLTSGDISTINTTPGTEVFE
jgi:hypothetical protein